MFFLLFGLRTRDAVLSRRRMVCEVCGVNAPQTVVKRSTKFTLFFIPLFSVRPSSYYMECGNCGSVRPVDRRAVDYLAAPN
jgi:uncharacterized Zn finger protein